MNAPTSDPGLRAQRAYNQPRALPFAGLTNYRDIKGRALGWLDRQNQNAPNSGCTRPRVGSADSKR